MALMYKAGQLKTRNESKSNVPHFCSRNGNFALKMSMNFYTWISCEQQWKFNYEILFDNIDEESGQNMQRSSENRWNSKGFN